MLIEEMSELPALLERAVAGDADAVCAPLSGQRQRLKRSARSRALAQLGRTAAAKP